MRSIGNLLRWGANGPLPVDVEGPGYVGAYLYRKGDKSLLHLINGSGIDNGEQMKDRAYPVGPLKIRVRAPGGRSTILSSDTVVEGALSGETVEFVLPRLTEYELALLQ